MSATFSSTQFLTASRCNGQRQLSLQELVREIIDLATDHANQLGIGYARLAEDSMAWVLSRLSIEMDEWPAMHTTYSITTWVESVNRLFSSRCFKITSGDPDGKVMGYIRSMWAAIDMTTRKAADLSRLEPLANAVTDIPCDIEPAPKLRMPESENVRGYIFVPTDIDCNRHVTTARYVELCIDVLTLDDYDKADIRRFDIAFSHEALAGEHALISSSHLLPDGYMFAISDKATAKEYCIARQLLRPRP